MRKKVAIYVRLSEEDRNKASEFDDSQSIQNQKSLLIKYALDNEWEISNIYSDDNYAGADRNRPEWNRLLQDAEERKFDIILCKTQSRFTRELEMVEKYIHGVFPIWGIRFVSVVDNADTDNRGNKKSRQINGLVNEWYLEDLSDNIKEVLTDRRKNGYHIGSFALYGYKKDPDQKGHLLIDEEAAEVVREVFRLFVAGYGKSAIARRLNERGIPNPTTYKINKGIRKKRTTGAEGTYWKYYSISDMLINEIYIGNLVQGRYGSISYKTKQNRPRAKEEWIRVEGTHEPIIEQELWDAAQKLIKQRAKPFTIGKMGIFARKTRCMYCGYTMRSCKTKQYRYLRCSSREVLQDACIGSFIPQKELEEVILEELRRLISLYLDEDQAEELIQTEQKSKNKMLSMLSKEIEEGNRKREMLKQGLRQSYLDKVRGILLEEDYLEFAEEFHNSIEEIERRIGEKEGSLAELEMYQEREATKREILEKYTNITELNYGIIQTLIDYIEIGKRQVKTQHPPIVIHWNF